MDEILASIRRILHEEEPQAGATPAAEDELLVLDRSMMVSAPKPEPETPMLQDEIDRMLFGDAPTPAATPSPVHPVEADAKGADAPVAEPAPASLLAPETRHAAERSVDALRAALEPAPLAPPAPSLGVRRDGLLTLEDMVRDELRGQLKLWLDANLPDLVERVVREEIAQLVGTRPR
jgi:uncharacterized protein